MALKKDIQVTNGVTLKTDNGVELPFDQVITINDVYIKVTEVRAHKEGGTIFVRFSKDREQSWTNSYRFIPSVTEGAENFIAQAYKHLKTLPEFSGAVDV